MKRFICIACLFSLILGSSTFVFGQSFNAVVSPQSNFTYDIHLPEFTLTIDTEGKALGFEGANTIPVKFDLNGRPKQMGDKKITFDFLGRVASIGTIIFEYDLYNRVVKAGNIGIEYDFLSRKIVRIAGNQIEYDFLSKKIIRIGTAQIKYDIEGEMDSINDPDKIILSRGINILNN